MGEGRVYFENEVLCCQSGIHEDQSLWVFYGVSTGCYRSFERGPISVFTISKSKKRITLLEGYQTSPARPSRSSMNLNLLAPELFYCF